ncbi:hypothetical protein DFH07DRAFT_866812 [Mycena maculata]|uniref:Uncharacterized protein n=1 Tax=Mycena maculata TaxID=230809 RepID=A0AAD7JPP1_9AGAR|nr:hypothetical protein DFH07DRAFT_866812 [Mycena maculata]
MVNTSGANGHYNGTCPPDSVLAPALHDYSRKSLPLAQRLEYLAKDFGYYIGRTSLMKLNREFGVGTVKKPPPDHIASTLIVEVITNNVSSRNGPRTVQNQISLQDGTKIPRDTVRRLMADIDPDGAEARFPGRRRQPKRRGHLTDTGKLNFKALRMGPVGIDIYGSRCHSSSRMVKFLVVPNARCSSTVGHYYLDLVEENGVFVQATADGGSETGELYAAHVALHQHCMPEISFEESAPFIAMKSTNNISIESSWHLFTNYVGLDIKQVILIGKSHNYFHPSIIYNFVEYWINHKIRTQSNKLLPSGFSLNYICDFPEKFGLTHFGVPAPQLFVDALRQNIPKWVSDDFDARAWEVYNQIGAPKLVLTEGWTIFCQMLPHLNST